MAALVLAVELLAPGSARAQEPAAKGTPEPARLASRLAEAVAGAQRLVEKVRGQPFRGTVASAVLPEKDLPKILEKKLVEDLPTSFDRYAASLAALGLIDFEPELQRKLTRLYARQVAGFYDPEEKKFYIVPERSSEAAATVPQLGISSEDLMENALLTHELTHALQDRRLDLDKRMKQLKESTDALLALQAFLEGEATVVMTEAIVSRLPEEARSLFGRDTLSQMVASLAAGNLNIEGSEGVPDFFVKELIFPYVAGTKWIEKKRSGGGWPAVDAVYKHLPETTAEILHPDRPAGERLRLSRAERPSARDLPAGTRLLYVDTLGEWMLETLLERAEAPDASELAAEWQDDGIAFFEPKNIAGGPIGFVWRVRCRSASAARRLGDTLDAFFEQGGNGPEAAVTVSGDLVEVQRGRAPRPGKRGANAPPGT